jgi:hypothetical protein
MATEFWRERRRSNRRSKIAFVCPRIVHAQEAHRMLRQMGVRAGIATTDDDEIAEQTILQFRGKHPTLPEIDALVAVGKVYEGMDCPEADVLCCLTHIRSTEWIEQMLHRVTRFDRYGLPWEQQFATIFAPKDRFFLEIMATIKRDQAPYVDEVLTGNGGSGGTTPVNSGFRPRESEIGKASAYTFTDPPVEGQDYEDVDAALKASGLFGALSTINGKKFADALRQQQSKAGAPINATAAAQTAKAPQTPSQREAKLRKDISELQRSGYDPNDSTTSEVIRLRGRRFYKMFGKGLEDLSETQLQAVWNARATWM